jgi:hypothetical protein
MRYSVASRPAPRRTTTMAPCGRSAATGRPSQVCLMPKRYIRCAHNGHADLLRERIDGRVGE